MGPPPPPSAEMVQSSNYEFKWHPPEVAPSIKLSWGQSAVAAIPVGADNPSVCDFSLSQKGVGIIARLHLTTRVFSHPLTPFLSLSLLSSHRNCTLFCFFHLHSYSLSLLSSNNSRFFISLPPAVLLLFPSSSSGKGLTRPSENSKSYIWEFITLRWRLPVCRAESETQGEERVRREREKRSGLD